MSVICLSLNFTEIIIMMV